MAFWDENEQLSDYDMIKDTVDQQNIPTRPTITEEEPVNEELNQEIQDNSAFELEETEVDVVYQARLRLEQARLYDMLINHNIFEGVQANPDAISIVQDELKAYILERLQILLGIRKEVKIQEREESKFNDVEADFLKQLAYKGTKGASVVREDSGLNPLNPIKSQTGLKPLVPQRPVQAAPVVQKSVQKTVVKKEIPLTKPVKKERVHTKIVEERSVHKSINSDGFVDHPRIMTQAEAEAIAREDLKRAAKKSFDKMTDEEKIAQIVKVNERHAKKAKAETIPIPSGDEMAIRYQTSQSIINNKDDKAMLNNAALSIIKHKINTGE
jgi:hypothetical protein